MFELLLSALIWSTTPVFAKLAYSQGATPLSLVEVRLLTATLLFLLILHRRALCRGLKENLPAIFTLSAFGLGANFYLYHSGLSYTSAASAQVLESTSPIFALFLASFLGVERFSILKVIAVLLSFAGVAVIFKEHLYSTSLIGDIIELFAGITWAVFTTGSAVLLRKLDTEESLLYVFSFSFLLLLPFTLEEGFTFRALPFGILMGVLHTFAAYILYLRGIEKHKPVVASMVFTLSPIFTLFFSRGFLGEVESAEFYAGSILVIAGIGLALRSQ